MIRRVLPVKPSIHSLPVIANSVTFGKTERLPQCHAFKQPTPKTINSAHELSVYPPKFPRETVDTARSPFES